MKAAMIQMRTGVDVSDNISFLRSALKSAKENGALIAFTPEMTSLLDKRPGELEGKVQLESDDFALSEIRGIAKELGIIVQVGSLPIRNRSGKISNRSYTIDNRGQIVAKYSKIHMFDVDLPDGQVIRESQRYSPGEKAILAKTDVGIIGMTICYDVRFPNLYSDIAKAGAEIISVPSAFTVPTGSAHWHILLRARAIENGCYVVAAAQGGVHEDGRETYGHSLVVSPWGEVIAEGGVEPEVIHFTMDLNKVDEARNRIPNLRNYRKYSKPKSFG